VQYGSSRASRNPAHAGLPHDFLRATAREAGMTGAYAFVPDRHRVFVDHHNHELVDIHRIDSEQTGHHRNLLYRMIGDFVAATGRRRGQTVLDDFSGYLGCFRLVKPRTMQLDVLPEVMANAA
jgi:glutamate synthase (NADPH/NADH) large chain